MVCSVSQHSLRCANNKVGMANIGLGALEEATAGTAQAFYSEVANYAKQAGVTVSVITIAGSVRNVNVLCIVLIFSFHL